MQQPLINALHINFSQADYSGQNEACSELIFLYDYFIIPAPFSAQNDQMQCLYMTLAMNLTLWKSVIICDAIHCMDRYGALQIPFQPTAFWWLTLWAYALTSRLSCAFLCSSKDPLKSDECPNVWHQPITAMTIIKSVNLLPILYTWANYEKLSICNVHSKI